MVTLGLHVPAGEIIEGYGHSAVEFDDDVVQSRFYVRLHVHLSARVCLALFARKFGILAVKRSTLCFKTGEIHCPLSEPCANRSSSLRRNFVLLGNEVKTSSPSIAIAGVDNTPSATA